MNKTLNDYAPLLNEGGEGVLTTSQLVVNGASHTKTSFSPSHTCKRIVEEYLKDNNGLITFDDLWERLASVYRKKFGKEMVLEAYNDCQYKTD